jgi:hypothetical protein
MLVLVADVGDDVRDLLARDGGDVVETPEEYYEQYWGVSINKIPCEWYQ